MCSSVLRVNKRMAMLPNKAPARAPFFPFFSCALSVFFTHLIFFLKKIAHALTGSCPLPCHKRSKTPARINKTVQALLVGIGLFSSVVMVAQAQTQEQAPKRYHLNLPAQSVADSLTQLSEQTKQMLLLSYEVADTLQASPVMGYYTLQEALNTMLEGTGHSGGLTQKGVLMISLVKSPVTLKKTKGEDGMKTRKKVLAATIAFFSGVGASPLMAQEGTASTADVSLLEEIVVTATKRETSLQDTAMSISAIGGETIDKRNLVGMEDYLPSLPGVSMQDRGAGQNNVTIRGISAGNEKVESPATGIYFGETPVTGLNMALNGGGSGSGDIKLVDIERVEVLRGPQGTLYGAGSMGGTVRVMPNTPDLEEIGGTVSARYSQTGEEGGDNTMVNGAINVPVIEDQLAIRAVAYEFDNDGFIDNVAGSQPTAPITSAVGLGATAVDRKSGGDNYTGFRLSTLWRPVDELDVTLSYLNQEIEQAGSRDVNLGLPGKFQQARLAVGESAKPEGQVVETDIINLVVKYDLGWGELSSSTSKIDHEASSRFDIGNFDFSGEPLSSLNSLDIDSTIEELRFTSDFEGALQVLFGYYYEDRETLTVLDIFWYGDLSDISGYRYDTGQVLEQQSLFGELSYQLTDSLIATGGFRWFDYEKSTPLSLFNGAHRTELESRKGTVDDTNFKFNLAYTFNDSTLVYGEWAEGFRFGNFQTQMSQVDDPDGDGVVLFADGIERKVTEGLLESDTVESIELGVKTAFMDERVTLSASVFHIDWTGIPVSLTSANNASYQFNAGEVKSEGVELEVQALLSDSLILNLSSSYIETRLTEDAPELGGEKGDHIPSSADFNFSMGLEHRFTIAEYDSFVRADYLYVSEYFHVVDVPENEPASGGYSLIDLKLGVNFANIDLDLFVKNLTNADDLTWVETSWGAGRAFRLRPRTVGFNVAYSF
jgi:iron complex outermembrane receptor protein